MAVQLGRFGMNRVAIVGEIGAQALSDFEAERALARASSTLG